MVFNTRGVFSGYSKEVFMSKNKLKQFLFSAIMFLICVFLSNHYTNESLRYLAKCFSVIKNSKEED